MDAAKTLSVDYYFSGSHILFIGTLHAIIYFQDVLQTIRHLSHFQNAAQFSKVKVKEI